jgi:hypothetical protein
MKRFLITLLAIAIATLTGAQSVEDFDGDFTLASAAGYITYPAELAGVQPEPGEYKFDAHIVLYENSPWSAAISADYFFPAVVTISDDQEATIAQGRWSMTIPWDEYCPCYLTENDPPRGVYKIDALTFHGNGIAIHWTGVFQATGSIGPWWDWKDGAFRTATELLPIGPPYSTPDSTRRTSAGDPRRSGGRRPQ